MKKEAFLSISLFLLVILAISYPYKITNYPSFVDWRTIIALTGLLVITTGLKESKYFYAFSRKVLKRLKSERSLSIFLILLSVLLSTFLTNDVTLFAVIPLTVSIQNLVKNDISKLVIFEVIGVNVGSALTPIGNPQNLFLWHKWGVSFMAFIIKMFPLVAILLTTLLICVWIVFPNKKIKFSEEVNGDKTQKKVLFIFSIVMLIVYIISLEVNRAYLILLPVFIFYFLFYRRVLLKTDWLLLLLFIVIFIDFHVISTIPVISEGVNTLNLHSGDKVFLFSTISSQLISNVPASVFVSKFSHNWSAITYGVNVGGNGLAISSLANIIALRMIGSKKIWLTFHKYSIVYFLITGGVVYTLFYIL
ncbi:MAG: hypothetical protein B5M53_09600 [Candidatus Cloacimonas sp. 4484_209]|nr:MAG: hypothetical protein B5M53_09600 [Candidatus Cloacimonas sp. 4484_209]